MHEFSLVRALLQQVKAVAQREGGFPVTEIRVEIGPLAGVEPFLLESAFHRLAPSSTADGARLMIDEVPLEAVCERCGATFAVDRFRFRCSHCDSAQVRVTRGEELRLVSVTLAVPEPAAEQAP